MRILPSFACLAIVSLCVTAFEADWDECEKDTYCVWTQLVLSESRRAPFQLQLRQGVFAEAFTPRGKRDDTWPRDGDCVLFPQARKGVGAIIPYGHSKASAVLKKL
jgi:hypothetical protein